MTQSLDQPPYRPIVGSATALNYACFAGKNQEGQSKTHHGSGLTGLPNLRV
jgi:hypothetical protein